MRISMVTDSWPPVVSGVVRTIQTTVRELERMGHQVGVIEPSAFTSVRCPSDTHLRLAVLPGQKLGRMIKAFDPDAIHLASEAPLGVSARRWCLKHGLAFTTCYTTRLPEYMEARFRIPARFAHPYVRWFHHPSSRVMVSTDRLRRELATIGVRKLAIWGRGVDTRLFRPAPKGFLDAPRPILMHVGRVATEKNIKAFLDLNVPGTKYVVGDGPQLAELTRAYPHVRFVGNKHGEELARHYAAADVFVFPSRTDTFGLVLLESLACGVPVAAYPVPGPLDVLGGADVGVLHEDLGQAVRQAVAIPGDRCRSFAEQFDWQRVTRQFLDNLVPARPVMLPMPQPSEPAIARTRAS